MKVGLLAFSTNTGLGYQTLEFYRHMKPHKTLVADISRLNGMQQHHERYPDARIVRGVPDCSAMDWLTDDVDAVFVCETPLNYCLFEKAKAKGVTAILQYNYEFLDYLNRPELEKPTVLAAPTRWHFDDMAEKAFAPLVEWPVPVNRQQIPFRKIEQCKTFVHIIGRPAVHDRNGTLIFLEAIKKIGSRFNYKVYYQEPIGQTAQDTFRPILRALEQAKASQGVEIIKDTKNYADMYATGDVLVMPRRYGGLCLPVNEALSAGMPVIMPDITPNNDWLPKEWLVPAKRAKSFFTRTEIDTYDTDANFLAFKMLEFGKGEFIQWSNDKANELAETLSWENQKTNYERLLEQVCVK